MMLRRTRLHPAMRCRSCCAGRLCPAMRVECAAPDAAAWRCVPEPAAPDAASPATCRAPELKADERAELGDYVPRWQPAFKVAAAPGVAATSCCATYPTAPTTVAFGSCDLAHCGRLHSGTALGCGRLDKEPGH